jgi:hypothetical protein
VGTEVVASGFDVIGCGLTSATLTACVTIGLFSIGAFFGGIFSIGTEVVPEIFTVSWLALGFAAMVFV